MKEDGNVISVHVIVTFLPKNNVINVKLHNQRMLNFSFLNNNKKKMDNDRKKSSLGKF